MPQKPPAIGEDVSALFGGSSAPDIGADVSQLFEGADSTAAPSPYRPELRFHKEPFSSEDFTGGPTSGWPAKLGDVAIGALKGLGSSAATIAELAINSGAVPGVTSSFANEAFKNPALSKAEEYLVAQTPGEKIGKGIETAAELALPAYEAGKAGIALAKAIPAVAKKAGPAAIEVASHLPVIGRPIKAARLLGKILDFAVPETASSPNVGGKLITKASERPTFESEISKILEELRAPEPPQSVELPPPVELPTGYAPRTTVPVPKETAVPSNAGGRLVKSPEGSSFESEISKALDELRQPEPPARVTTPPQPELPPGYQPRTTAPKPKAAKATPKPAEPSTAPKRPYFLRSPEELAALKAAREPVEASADIAPSDLPASWRTHTGQNLFPMTGAEGKAVTDALRAELKARGMSVGQAISQISRNKNLPTDVRFNLIRSLSGAK